MVRPASFRLPFLQGLMRRFPLAVVVKFKLPCTLLPAADCRMPSHDPDHNRHLGGSPGQRSCLMDFCMVSLVFSFFFYFLILTPTPRPSRQGPRLRPPLQDPD